jgi:hypothetical protein
LKRLVRLGLLAKLGLVLAVLAEWAAGSACLTPQITKEVQRAKPLPAKETRATVSGGMTWAPTGVQTVAVPNNPNADVNVLVRHGTEEDKEVQVPVNLSLRLGPGIEDPNFLGVHLSSGLLFKRAKPVSFRPLYNAWVFGPTLGMYATWGPEDYRRGDMVGWCDEEGCYDQYIGPSRTQPEQYPVSPFGGFYVRYIHEWLGKERIKSIGFLLSANLFPTELLNKEDVTGWETYYFPPIEGFAGAVFGSVRKRCLIQTVIGVAYHRLYGPKIVVGTTFGQKLGKRGRS